LIYWAKSTWFMRTSEHRADLIAENEGVAWHPGHLKWGRFGKWLEGNVDWALSRDRYWGTPMPVWRCVNDHDACVGSIEELSRLAGRDDLSAVDLHRPFIDEVIVVCPTCGGESRRIEPVLDAWFDSGAMPTSQHHFPFGDRSLFEGSFPADFICEAIDQTRGWFYSLLAVNVLALGEAPYRNVVCLGLVVDDQGMKMSKSRGNVVDPWAIFDQLGADAMRWNFFSFGQPWTPRRISEESIRESSAQTLVKLWNVFCFAQTYAELDGWSPPTGADAGSRRDDVHHVLDRWVLSQLDSTITAVGDLLEGYDALGAATRIAQFVDDLSNWYVRRGRPRYWMLRDATAHLTLYQCLETLTRLLAPFCPMFSDEIYTRLTGRDSVHLTDWPSIGGYEDAALDAQMSAARRLVALGRTARSRAGVKVRQPLPRALVLHPGIRLSEAVEAEVADELNVKRIEDVASVSELVSWTVAPNFRKLGPRLGPRVNDIKEALNGSDGSALRRQLDEDGYVEVIGERLLADEVEVRASALESLTLVEEDGWAVALDLSVTEDLVREGRARELVRAVNDLRKDQGFEIADRVHAFFSGDKAAEEVVAAYRDWIAREILAEKMVWLEREDRGGGDSGTTVDLDGAEARMRLVLA
jgi:isoleucyl-tRNA synthetase